MSGDSPKSNTSILFVPCCLAACSFSLFDFKSVNVTECYEFRALLLLLQSDRKESMIPHCTKLRELIVEAWQRYFQKLKLELLVPHP